MIKISFILVVSFVASVARAKDVPDIFLPADVDTVNIIGNGFRLTVNQLDNIKNQWQNVAQETAKVTSPRKVDEDTPVVNSHLYEETKKTSGSNGYGDVEGDLLDWIVRRATALNDKAERYSNEMSYVQSSKKIEGTKVVLDILFMNALVDLENLAQEKIKPLRWIKNKLKTRVGSKSGIAQEVDAYITNAINENKVLESKAKNTNKPADQWFTNVKAMKRILQEQRFSDDVINKIVDYLGGQFSMMKRSGVFYNKMVETKKAGKKLNDGLYYFKGRGRIPEHFSFSAQDAIVNGA